MKKRFIAIVVIVICAIFALFVFFVSARRQMLRNRLDNDIINSWYSGWQTVRLDEEHFIKIPDGWSLQTGELLALYDDAGKQIAFGKKYSGTPNLNKTRLFLSEYFEDQVTNYALLDTQSIDDTDNNWAETVYTFNSGKKIRLLIAEFYVHDPNDTNSVYVLYFEEPTDELQEIATAMIYSAGGGWTYYSDNGRFSLFGLG